MPTPQSLESLRRLSAGDLATIIRDPAMQQGNLAGDARVALQSRLYDESPHAYHVPHGGNLDPSAPYDPSQDAGTDLLWTPEQGTRDTSRADTLSEADTADTMDSLYRLPMAMRAAQTAAAVAPITNETAYQTRESLAREGPEQAAAGQRTLADKLAFLRGQGQNALDLADVQGRTARDVANISGNAKVLGDEYLSLRGQKTAMDQAISALHAFIMKGKDNGQSLTGDEIDAEMQRLLGTILARGGGQTAPAPGPGAAPGSRTPPPPMGAMGRPTIRMRAPDGTESEIDPGDQQHYEALGAVRIR